MKRLVFGAGVIGLGYCLRRRASTQRKRAIPILPRGLRNRPPDWWPPSGGCGSNDGVTRSKRCGSRTV